MASSERDFNCQKCGHTESKEGKIGNSGYDKVKKPGFNAFSMGTSMLITCCAACGEVSSMRIENPNAL
jgi:transcription elongation factor Elf1